MKRRTLLVGGSTALGALVVGFAALPPRGRLGGLDTLPVEAGEVGLDGWIKIAADGRVVLAMNRSEMGQGVHTALAMLVAEELDVALSNVRLEPAGFDAIYGNVHTLVATLPFHPRELEDGATTLAVDGARWMTRKLARELGLNATGGSSSVSDAWPVLRLAAAVARARLLGAASLQWRQPVAELSVEDGVVRHASGPRASYAELARAAAATPPGDARPKPASQRKLVGTPARRLDGAAKCDGSAVFGTDVRPPGLLHAAIRHAPSLGGGIGFVDADAATSRPGVVRVVRLGSYAGSTPAVAVVARGWWTAEQALRAMRIETSERPGGGADSDAIAATLERTARDAATSGAGWTWHSRGDAEAALAEASAATRGDGATAAPASSGASGAASTSTSPRLVERFYRAPYLAHAAMEPINVTARVDASRSPARVEVWAPTQVPGLAREVAAAIAGVPAEAVQMHVPYLGGGFGRRLEVDAVAQAVRIALECGGRPVQLTWSREEDLRHDFYRPAGAALLRGVLDDRGRPLAIAATSAGDAIVPRWSERNFPLLASPVDFDKSMAEGLFDQAYAIAHQRFAHVATRSGVPIGYWRSVGHSHNAFFLESFLDELAHAGGRDPLEMRLELLEAAPRHAAVLRAAAAAAGWSTSARLPPGRGRGLALHESFGSVVAQVVEASVANGRVRVHRVVCAADVGTVVNPRIVEQQLQGAIGFALSAALCGRVDIARGVVAQGNFDTLPVLRFEDSPVVETHLVASARAPSGVGEIGVPPLAPALANAIFAATGERLRELPLRIGGDPSLRSG